MAKREIRHPTLPPAAGYSRGIDVTSQRTVYVAGQIAIDGDGRVVGRGDIKVQAQTVFSHIAAILEAAGASMKDVVKITTFVTDLSQMATVREVRNKFFTAPVRPASTSVEVSALGAGPDFMIEVEAIAEVE